MGTKWPFGRPDKASSLRYLWYQYSPWSRDSSHWENHRPASHGHSPHFHFCFVWRSKSNPANPWQLQESRPAKRRRFSFYNRLLTSLMFCFYLERLAPQELVTFCTWKWLGSWAELALPIFFALSSSHLSCFSHLTSGHFQSPKCFHTSRLLCLVFPLRETPCPDLPFIPLSNSY